MGHNKQKEWDDHHNKNVQLILNAPIPELPKQKDDTELWDEVGKILQNHWTISKVKEELQKHYTITRK